MRRKGGREKGRHTGRDRGRRDGGGREEVGRMRIRKSGAKWRRKEKEGEGREGKGVKEEEGEVKERVERIYDEGGKRRKMRKRVKRRCKALNES